MKKISTLFKKNPENLSLVTTEVDPNNAWVYDGFAIPTRKFDGTSCAVIDEILYKRYDAKLKNRAYKNVPKDAIPCQEPDPITGHWPHWVKCDRNNPADKYHFEAWEEYVFSQETIPPNGTYELIGLKIQGNPEKLDRHVLVPHGKHTVSLTDFSYESLKNFLEETDIEGIVFHNPDGKMCKIRKIDFGFKR